MKKSNSSRLIRFARILIAPALILFIYSSLFGQSSILLQRGEIVRVRIKGIQLIEKGMIYSALNSMQGTKLSPEVVAEDIKSLYGLGYFKDVSAEIEVIDTNKIILTFNVSEKPRIGVIEITGNSLIDTSSLKKEMKILLNNMISVRKIKEEMKIILNEYHKEGYMQTQVKYTVSDIDNSTVSLVFHVVESPKVYLTKINVTGTKVYPPLDIERLMMSSEIDCFAWANDSGVFQESKINQDLQIITQHYYKNGYIKMKIDKPKVVLIKNRDYSRVEVKLNITEGNQYFTGKLDIKSADGHEFLFDKQEMIDSLKLKTGEVFNIFDMNEGRYKISDIYLEQGYAFSKVRLSYNANEDTKTVDFTLSVTKGEKAYIGRVEIQGNYETLDSVVRRELEIHDNELYNGVKLRTSRSKITALGFFKPNTGVRFQQAKGEEENTLDYNILLEEGQTGTFSASLTYSGESGMALIASVSKKNFMGTGKTLTFSTEQKGEGEGSRYDFSMVNPYWFDTEFTNSFRIFSILESETYYDTRTSGFNYGLSYPIWKNWNASSNYSWKDEYYTNIDSEYGDELLDGITENTYRSLSLGLNYSTVNHPLFPSKGFEASFYSEQYGGLVLGGSTEYQVLNLNTRYFKTLNKSGTLVFGAKFNWAQLLQTNTAKEVPSHNRYTIGGITTVRGFDWNEIRGPSSIAELDGFDISELYPTAREDYINNSANGIADETACSADATCDAQSTDKVETREYYEQHSSGITKRVLNLQMYFPLTREGSNIRGLIFFDMGNVWAEDRMYEITGVKKDDWDYRKSVGAGVNLITPMGVLRFEYGIKLDKRDGESASKFDFHISGLF